MSVENEIANILCMQILVWGRDKSYFAKEKNKNKTKKQQQ